MQEGKWEQVNQCVSKITLIGNPQHAGNESYRNNLMDVYIDSHTLKHAAERGTNEAEIHDVLSSGFVIPAKYNRLGKAKIYPFGKERHGTFFEQKRVEVYYLEE